MPAPRTPREALTRYLDPATDPFEREYLAMMIGSLPEGRDALFASCRDETETEMLQQRAAEQLANALRDIGRLADADCEDFTPIAKQEFLFQRGEGEPFRG